MYCRKLLLTVVTASLLIYPVFARNIRELGAFDTGRRHLAVSPCPAICPDNSTCGSSWGAPECVCNPGLTLANKTCVRLNGSYPHAEWLLLMNQARAAVGSPPLQWSQGLENQTIYWSNYLATQGGCMLTHQKNVGQNLYGGYNPNYDRKINTLTAVGAWLSEALRYRYAVFDGKTSGCITGNWANCGHYTQVIWSTSIVVGCAWATCPGDTGRIYACNFAPGGNVIGKYPYVRDPCYNFTCNAPFVCNNTAGRASCVCPSGTRIFNGNCIKDPCLPSPCSGNQTCNSASGAAVCSCPPATVLLNDNNCGDPCVVSPCPGNYQCTRNNNHTRSCVCPAGLVPANDSFCLPKFCVGVQCPGGASCTAGATGVPVCTCPAGQAFNSSNICSNATRGAVAGTSVAFFGGYGFKLGGVSPVILRAPMSKCINLPAPLAGNVSSYMIQWKVDPEPLPPNTAFSFCNFILFWTGYNCFGNSASPTKSTVYVGLAQGAFAKTRAIQCV